MLQKEKPPNQPKKCCQSNYTCTSNLVKTNYNSLLQNLIIPQPKPKIDPPKSVVNPENSIKKTTFELLTKELLPIPTIVDIQNPTQNDTSTTNSLPLSTQFIPIYQENSAIQLDPPKIINQCVSTCSIKKRTRAPFSKEEDEKLKELVNFYSNIEDNSKWYFIASQIPGRTARQCRERFQLFLSEGIRRKEKWTKEEDDVLLQQYSLLGPHWKSMEKFFVGRTSYSIKNRYISLNRHRKHFNSDSPPADDE